MKNAAGTYHSITNVTCPVYRLGLGSQLVFGVMGCCQAFIISAVWANAIDTKLIVFDDHSALLFLS